MARKDRADNTRAERVAKFHLLGQLVPRRKCIDMSKRRRLEKASPKWLRFFFPRTFYLDWGPTHLQIIEKCDYAIEHGEWTAASAPRGEGKSATVNGMAIKSLLSGKAVFPAVIPWKSKDASKAMRFWKNALSFNPLLADYYPEICDPFAFARGVAMNDRSAGRVDAVNGEREWLIIVGLR